MIRHFTSRGGRRHKKSPYKPAYHVWPVGRQKDYDEAGGDEDDAGQLHPREGGAVHVDVDR